MPAVSVLTAVALVAVPTGADAASPGSGAPSPSRATSVTTPAVAMPSTAEGTRTPSLLPGRRSRLVLAPRPGQRITAHPVHVVVRAGSARGDLTATLNSTRVTGDFGLGQGGIRSLDASSSHGLRHGINVLTVRVRTRDGGHRTSTVRFRVAHRRVLAGAGKDRVVPTGREARIDGSVRRHPASLRPGQRAASARGVTLSWTVVRAPQGSAITAGSAPRRARGLAPRISPDVPGRYILRLTARDARGATRDTVSLDASPKTPSVVLDTMPEVATGSMANPGITVGSTRYPVPPLHPEWPGQEHADTQYQVLVLKRSTLEPVWNRAYGVCPVSENEDVPCHTEAGQSGQVRSALATDLATLTPEDLVIVATHQLFESNADQFPRDLAGIGVAPVPGFDPNMEFTMGVLAVVGVPGMAAGDATVLFNPNNLGQPTGRLTGLLVRGSYGYYGFVSDQRPLFDTRAGGGCNPAGSDCTTTVRVGDPTKDFNAELVDGSGYVVTVYDPYTLKRIDWGTFATNAGASTDQANAMTTLLARHTGGELVVISSLIDPANPVQRTAIGANASKASVAALGAQVARVGGTLHGFFTGGTAADSGYALVGWAGAGQGAGEEAVGANARLRGTLSQDRSLLFRPVRASQSGAPSETLTSLMVAPATPWKYADQPRILAAMSYIGSQSDQLGSDPRSMYWQLPDGTDWNGIITDIATTDYPGSNPDYSEDEFDKARSALVQELKWVRNTYSYMTRISAPFTSNGSVDWAQVQVIADQVRQDVQAAQSTQVDFNPFYLFEAFDELAGPWIGEATDVIGGLFELGALAFDAAADGSPRDKDIKVTADQVGLQLLQAGQGTGRAFRSMADVIVSDYGKLSVVGAKGGCNPQVAGCPPELAYGPNDQGEARAMASRSVERVAYETFIPEAYDTYLMPYAQTSGSYLKPQPTTTDVTKVKCIDSTDWYRNYPFKSFTPKGSVALLDTLLPADQKNNGFTVYALGQRLGSLVWFSDDAKPLADPLLTRLFAPVSASQDPTAGGLGIDMAEFLRTMPDKIKVGTVKETGICDWGDW